MVKCLFAAMVLLIGCTPTRIVRSKPVVAPTGKVLFGPIVEVGGRSGVAGRYTEDLRRRIERMNVKFVGTAADSSIARTAEQAVAEDWDVWVYGFIYANQAETGTGFAGGTLPTATVWLTAVSVGTSEKLVSTQRITLQGDRWIDSRGFSLDRLIDELVNETVTQLSCADQTGRKDCVASR